jgi:hypothetical protein
MTSNLASLTAYQDGLGALEQRVVSARLRAALATSSELVALYCEIGAQIADGEMHARWGSGFIDACSQDLRRAFPEVGGFSPKILRHYRQSEKARALTKTPLLEAKNED